MLVYCMIILSIKTKKGGNQELETSCIPKMLISESFLNSKYQTVLFLDSKMLWTMYIFEFEQPSVSMERHQIISMLKFCMIKGLLRKQLKHQRSPNCTEFFRSSYLYLTCHPYSFSRKWCTILLPVVSHIYGLNWIKQVYQKNLWNNSSRSLWMLDMK